MSPIDFPTILCVEDEPSLLELRRLQFERAGYRVFTAGGAEEALRTCAREKIDLVLTDYRLPGMSGVALGWLLKRNQPDLLVVLVTGAIDLEADPRGVDLVLPKPMDTRELLSAIGELLGPAQQYGT
jgi:two-component system response regulator GlrR